MDLHQDLYQRCRWPELPQPTERALREAIRFILERFETNSVRLHGIIAAGTHISGNPDPRSDLDIYVINAQPLRQRIQKRFNGIATEIFINPPQVIRRYFAEEIRRPSTAHMLATGFVLLNTSPVVDELCAEAQEWLQRPLALTDAEITRLRYAAADAYENAQDLQQVDVTNAMRMLHDAMGQMLDFTFLRHGQTIPRQKSFLHELEKLNPELGTIAHRYYLAANVQDKFDQRAEIAALTISVSGFFEWESPLEKVDSAP